MPLQIICNEKTYYNNIHGRLNVPISVTSSFVGVCLVVIIIVKKTVSYR